MVGWLFTLAPFLFVFGIFALVKCASDAGYKRRGAELTAGYLEWLVGIGACVLLMMGMVHCPALCELIAQG